MAPREDRLALAAFVGSALLSGGNAVAVRFSNRELDPLWGAGLRFALAATVLLGIVLVRRMELPRGRALLGASLYGLFNFGGSFALAYYALVQLHAGFGQTILALVPLLTLLLAVAHRQERMRMAALAGSLLAVGGIVIMSGLAAGGSVPVPSLLAAMGSAVCFAEAAVLVRRFPRSHPVTMNAVGMTVGAIFLLSAALIAGERFQLPRLAATWTALAYVVVVGSVLVFILYLVVLRRWVASRAAYVFVLIPVVTFALSAWLDDEPIGWTVALGALLVLVGVYVGALRQEEVGEGAAREPMREKEADPG